MRSSNPVLTRLTPERGYAQPAYPSSPYPGATATGPLVLGPTTAPAADRMTIDDTVIKTAALLVLTGVAAALAWLMDVSVGLLIPLVLVGFVAGLVITFKRVTNPLAIGAYAVIEGLVVGVISKLYNGVYEGIVTQALFGTFGIFFVMTLLYRSKVIRATPRFTKFVTTAVIGAAVFYAVSLMISIFSDTNPLRSGGLGIIISLVLIVIASMTFVLDFAQIEEAVAQGAPRRYGWLCAYGILVGLIWLYLEILRLLSMLQRSN